MLLSILLQCWSGERDFIVFDNGISASREARTKLDSAGIPIVEGPVDSVARAGEDIAITTAESEVYYASGMFVMPTMHQRAPFAEQLGLTLNPSGGISIDLWGKTSVPGVLAAGDAAHHPEFPMPMTTVVQAMQMGLIAGSMAVQQTF